MSATPPRPSADDFLRIGPRVRVLPIIHGSGDFAIRVREELLARPYDCVAVPLPPSFQDDVEAAIERLPAISVVVQRDAEAATTTTTSRASATCRSTPARGSSPRSGWPSASGSPRAFIDLETPRFEAHSAIFPDPYALKRVSPEGFAAAVLPAIPPPRPGQHAERIAWMADQLHELERRYRHDPARLLAARLALDPRRLRAAARGGRARAVLRADPDLRGRPEDADLRCSASCRS